MRGPVSLLRTGYYDSPKPESKTFEADTCTFGAEWTFEAKPLAFAKSGSIRSGLRFRI